MTTTLEINDNEFNFFMRSIGAESMPAIKTARKARAATNIDIDDGVLTLPGIVSPTPAYVPGACWYGITRTEAADAVARTFGTPAAGHVIAPFDVPGFCIEQGEIIPVIETRPASVNVRDVVLFASAGDLYGPSDRVMDFGVGEVREIHKRFGGSFGICSRAGRILRERLGIGYARMGGWGYCWISAHAVTLPDDVRARGHILAVLNLDRREGSKP